MTAIGRETVVVAEKEEEVEVMVAKGKGVAPSLRNDMKGIERIGVVQEAVMTSLGFPEDGRRPYGGTGHQLVSSI